MSGTPLPTHDQKRLILPDAAPTVAAAYEGGVILPFASLFPQTEVLNVSEIDKRGRSIIQISFLICDETGRVLVTRRASHGSKTPFGHGTTLGGSVLVSWSPVALPPGHPWPLSHEDVLWAYRQEVVEETPAEPEFRFLGLARSFAGPDLDIAYYLYSFLVTYPGTPVIRKLKKDKDDEVTGFMEVGRPLLKAIAKKKGDLRVLQAAGFELGKVDFGRSNFLPAPSGDPPPYRQESPGCFVSHACVDHDRINPIVKRIEGARVPCWIDKRDTRSGFLWRSEYLEALDCTRSFVFVATRNSYGSDYVRDEIRRAMARRKREPAFPVIALALEGEKPEQFLPREWGTDRQASDFRTQKNARIEWRKVLDELRRAQPPSVTHSP